MSTFPDERRVSVEAPRPYPHDRRKAEQGPLQWPLPPGPRPAEPLPDPSDWSFELIEEYHEPIRAIAHRLGTHQYGCRACAKRAGAAEWSRRGPAVAHRSPPTCSTRGVTCAHRH